MDVAVDLYLAVPLLFTVLALVLASVFVRLRGGEGERAAERPREPAAAEPVREGGSGPGGEAAAPEEAAPAAAEGPQEEEEEEGGRVPVEEVGAGEEAKEAAGEQREAAAEPGPEVEPSPAVAESIPRPPPAESIPRPPPAEPREPENREEAESKIPPLGASPGSSLGPTGQAEGGCGQADLSSKAEEEDPDSENEKLVVREPEDEDAADETFSFKYSPGKLRGNQYKSMMTKEELEEEQSTIVILGRGRRSSSKERQSPGPWDSSGRAGHRFKVVTSHGDGTDRGQGYFQLQNTQRVRTEDYMKLSLASS